MLLDKPANRVVVLLIQAAATLWEIKARLTAVINRSPGMVWHSRPHASSQEGGMTTNKQVIFESIMSPESSHCPRRKAYSCSTETLGLNFVSFFSKKTRAAVNKAFISFVYIALAAFSSSTQGGLPEVSKVIRSGWYWLTTIDHVCRPRLMRLAYVQHRNTPNNHAIGFQLFSIPSQIDSTGQLSMDSMISAPWRMSDEQSLVLEQSGRTYKTREQLFTQKVVPHVIPSLPLRPLNDLLSTLSLPFARFPSHLTLSPAWTDCIKPVLPLEQDDISFVQALLQQGRFKTLVDNHESDDNSLTQAKAFLKSSIDHGVKKNFNSSSDQDAFDQKSTLIKTLHDNDVDMTLYDEINTDTVTMCEEKSTEASSKWLSSSALGVHMFPFQDRTLIALIPHRHLLQFISGSNSKQETHCNPAYWDEHTPAAHQTNLFPRAQVSPPPQTSRAAPVRKIVFEEELEPELDLNGGEPLLNTKKGSKES